MTRLFASLLLIAGITIPSDPLASAQDPGVPAAPAPPKAHLRPPADDANFDLMGEYVGSVTQADGSSRLLGLQVRPIGNDQFEGLSYSGGLPGQEGHQAAPTRVIGIRSGRFVSLSGGPHLIVVEPNQCLILDQRGEQQGRLDRVVRASPTLGAIPPEGAVVMFDGRSTNQFNNGRLTDAGLLMEGADFRPMFQDFNLHLEFRLPYMPNLDGQARGNSGVYLQSRYECQILDSFAQTRQFNGCGSLYRFRKPDLNMCLPPLAWQSYDIQFTAPRWASDGSKIRDAHATVWLNGVKIHDNVAIPNKTGAGKPEAPTLLPIRLQDHSDPVRFRNVWIVDRGLALGEFPQRASPGETPSVGELQASDAKDRDPQDTADAETAVADVSEPATTADEDTPDPAKYE